MSRIGRVTAYAPPSGVMVNFKTSGQTPSVYVRVGRDYSDGLRARLKPLPTIGSWGLVDFPDAPMGQLDIRNGVWLCCIEPGLLNALHYTGAQTDPYNDYESHYSGHWWLRDGLGNYSEQYPDGSYFIAASGTVLPTIFRHIVTSGQAQQAVPFARGDRIPSPPSPFNFIFTHATGTQLGINSAGNIMVSGVAGTDFSLEFGNLTITISAAGAMTIALPGTEEFSITQGGASASDSLALVSKLIAWLSTHTHGGVASGSAHTAVPDQSLTAATIESTALAISN